MTEKWQEIYTEEQLHKIQKIEIDGLKEFINVCNKLKINYVVYGGTLLGTIKYHGIIPWDDDVDVAMTRDDYMKFIKEAPSLLSDCYCLQTPYTDKKTPFAYSKLRKRGTKNIEEFYHKLDIEKGVYIDIYPIDNIPDDEGLRKKQYKSARFWILCYYFRQCLRIKKTKSIKKIIKQVGYILLYLILRILPQSFIIYQIDKSMSKYNSINTKRKGCLFSPNYNNIYENFYPIKKAHFGDVEVNIPNCYDDHLRKRYGNYEEDLPANKRIGHVPYEIEV